MRMMIKKGHIVTILCLLFFLLPPDVSGKEGNPFDMGDMIWQSPSKVGITGGYISGVSITETSRLELPSGTAQTLSTVGQIVHDDNVSGFEGGLIKWYDNSRTRYIVDLWDISSLVDGYVVAYDATNDHFYLKADAGGGGGYVDVKEGGNLVVDNATALDFNASDFDVTNSGGEASIVISSSIARDSEITFETLNTNGDVGTGSNQLAVGNHNHDGVYEPVFSKNSAFNKNFGTTSGTVCEGDDSRLSDERTPLDNSVTSAKIENGAIMNVDVNSGAGIVITKLSHGTLTNGKYCTYDNASDALVCDSDGGSGGSTSFADITTGENTSATMTVGSGASLTFDGTGKVDASYLSGYEIDDSGIADKTVLVYNSSTGKYESKQFQENDSVDINGGTIDNTTIGGSVPAPGTFSTLSTNNYSFPSGDGVSGQVLRTDGSGTLSWADDGDDLSDDSISDLSDVASMTEEGYDLFYYDNSTGRWSRFAHGGDGECLKYSASSGLYWGACGTASGGGGKIVVKKDGTVVLSTVDTLDFLDNFNVVQEGSDNETNISIKEDGIGTTELDDGTNLPSGGYALIVDNADNSKIAYEELQDSSNVDIDGGTIDNTTIGLTTSAEGYFTAITVTGAYRLPSSDGTSGQVMKTDGNGHVTWQDESGGGSGDVIGPSSNTDGYIPQWSGNDTKTLKNGLALDTSSLYTTDDTHVASSKLVSSELSGKADVSHTHTSSDITDFQTAVSNNTDVSANTSARHTHGNKSTLDSISDAGSGSIITSAERTKLNGIEDGATADQDASEVPITDSGGYYSSTDVEGALQEVGPTMTNERTPSDDSVTSDKMAHNEDFGDVSTDTNGLIEIDSGVVGSAEITNYSIINEDISNSAAISGDKLVDGTTNKIMTNATNVDAAGATMNSDTDVSGNGWVLDEDDMTSNDATKVPTQQSVKAYVDTSLSNYSGSSNITTVGTITSGTWQGTAVDDAHVSDSITVGSSGSVNDGALSSNVTKLGSTIELDSTETSGVLPVSKGGTGKTSVTSGYYVVGNGTGALVEKTPAQVRGDIGLDSDDDVTFNSVTVGGGSGGKMAWDSGNSRITFDHPITTSGSDDPAITLPNQALTTVVDTDGIPAIMTKGRFPFYKFIGEDSTKLDFDIGLINETSVILVDDFSYGMCWGTGIAAKVTKNVAMEASGATISFDDVDFWAVINRKSSKQYTKAAFSVTPAGTIEAGKWGYWITYIHDDGSTVVTIPGGTGTGNGFDTYQDALQAMIGKSIYGGFTVVGATVVKAGASSFVGGTTNFSAADEYAMIPAVTKHNKYYSEVYSGYAGVGSYSSLARIFPGRLLLRTNNDQYAVSEFLLGWYGANSLRLQDYSYAIVVVRAKFSGVGTSDNACVYIAIGDDNFSKNDYISFGLDPDATTDTNLWVQTVNNGTVYDEEVSLNITDDYHEFVLVISQPSGTGNDYWELFVDGVRRAYEGMATLNIRDISNWSDCTLRMYNYAGNTTSGLVKQELYVDYVRVFGIR